jgi:hypothetical protein
LVCLYSRLIFVIQRPMHSILIMPPPQRRGTRKGSWIPATAGMTMRALCKGLIHRSGFCEIVSFARYILSSIPKSEEIP